MNKEIFSSIIILASIIISASAAGCEVSSYVSACNYTVICNEKSTEIKDDTDCGDDAYVTLVVMNSVVNRFDEYFFRVFDFRHKVKELIAIDNTWTLLHGGAFEYFPNAVHFDLSDNKIEHLNSLVFVTNRKLQFLNLSRNIIETVDYSAFDFTPNSMEELDLSYNRYSNIRGEFRALRSLRKLHLQYNHLTEIPDDAFEYAVNTEYINLQHNRLTSLGKSFQYLPNLTTLDISYNYLTTLSSDEFDTLTFLVNFDISHNGLKSIELDCFDKVKYLQKADFSFNNIETVGDWFKNNTELTYLNFYHNNIVEVYENAFENCPLRYLNMDHNNITFSYKLPVIQETASPALPPVNTQNGNPNINEPKLTTIDEVNILQQEVQDLRTEIDTLSSFMSNLTFILTKYDDKLYNIYGRI